MLDTLTLPDWDRLNVDAVTRYELIAASGSAFNPARLPDWDTLPDHHRWALIRAHITAPERIDQSRRLWRSWSERRGYEDREGTR